MLHRTFEALLQLVVLTRNFSIFFMFSIKFRQYVTVCVAMLRDVSGANQSGLRHDLKLNEQNNYFADNSDFILILNDCSVCVCVCVCLCVS